MIGTIRKLAGKADYQPLNKIEISKAKLLSNYYYLSGYHKKVLIAPVLKSNAYGHGIKQIAPILDHGGCPFFCVDSIYEAYELLKLGVKTPVLITGYVDPENLKLKKLPFSYAVWSVEQIQTINQYQKGAGVHIFVDTGMNREGVRVDDLERFLNHFSWLPNIFIEGIMSHFASVDGPSDKAAKKQIKEFERAGLLLHKRNVKPKWAHIQASGGFLYQDIPWCNMARIGRAIYGIDPVGKDENLQPALSLKTKIIQIKDLKKGSRVGYSATYVAGKDMKIGILPIGYFDGVDRRLSNKGFVTVAGEKCPIIGLISMNITTIDLSRVKDPFVGQEVTVFSDNPADPNSVLNNAKLCRTIPHDLLVHLATSTRREVV